MPYFDKYIWRERLERGDRGGQHPTSDWLSADISFVRSVVLLFALAQQRKDPVLDRPVFVQLRCPTHFKAQRERIVSQFGASRD